VWEKGKVDRKSSESANKSREKEREKERERVMKREGTAIPGPFSFYLCALIRVVNDFVEDNREPFRRNYWQAKSDVIAPIKTDIDVQCKDTWLFKHFNSRILHSSTFQDLKFSRAHVKLFCADYAITIY